MAKTAPTQRKAAPKPKASEGAEAGKETAPAASIPAEAAATEHAATGQIIHVSSRRPQGRRRAGMAFTAEPRPVDTSMLSPREHDALLADPDLIVEPRLD